MTDLPSNSAGAEAVVTGSARQSTPRAVPPTAGALGVTVAVRSCGEASVALVGELDVAHAPHVARVLRALVDSGCNAVVDTSALVFIDATGVAALLRARGYADARGRTLLLVSPSACVLRMLELTAMSDLLRTGRVSSLRATTRVQMVPGG